MAKRLRFVRSNPHELMIDRRAMIFLFILLVGIAVAMAVIVALSG